jgi:hypothetical protein
MRKKRKNVTQSKRLAFIAASIVGLTVVGSVWLLNSHAGTFLASAEAESGTASPVAVTITDANASDGKAVQFAGTTAGDPTYAKVLAWVDAFAATHTGKATDINKASFNDPAAAQLRAVCGAGWTSIYPRLAWEYGGNDHAWKTPLASPLLICVHAPIKAPYTAEWGYSNNHVTALVFVKFPEQSPCHDQLLTCMQSDTTNMEILVDAAGGSDDGSSVGLNLSEASTELKLLLTNETTVHLWDDI